MSVAILAGSDSERDQIVEQRDLDIVRETKMVEDQCQRVPSCVIVKSKI